MRDIKLENMSEEEVGTYSPILQCVYDLFGNFEGEFYKISIDGKNYLLQRNEELFALYTLEIIEDEPVVGYEMFTVNDNYEVVSAGFDDFEVHTINGDKCVQDRDSYNIEYLSFLKRKDGTDVDGYDGTIGYFQYNQQNDVRLTLIYQQMHNSRSEVFGYQANKLPFQILIEKGLNAKKKVGIVPIRTTRYLQVHLNDTDNNLAYNTCAIREYGLSEVLSKGAYSLLRENRIVRYYKIMYCTEEGYARTTYPLGTGYKFESFDSLFEKYGFKKSIPEHIIKLHNGTFEEMNMYQDVASFVGEFEKDNTRDVTKLVLTFGGEMKDGTDN